jgi:hypothetical protein
MAAGTYAFSTAKASPLTETKVWQKDGANWARVALNLGTTELRLPYSGPKAAFAGKPYVASLSGLSYSMEGQEGSEALTLAHLGLGQAQSYVALGEHKLATVDLNALSGRHFDLRVEKGADGLAVLRVQPEFDLSVFTDMGPVYEYAAGEEPRDHRTNFHVRLSGGAPSVRPVAANTATGFPGGLQVVSGELSMAVNDARVTVPASKCLVKESTTTESPTGVGFAARDCQ